MQKASPTEPRRSGLNVDGAPAPLLIRNSTTARFCHGTTDLATIEQRAATISRRVLYVVRIPQRDFTFSRCSSSRTIGVDSSLETHRFGLDAL